MESAIVGRIFLGIGFLILIFLFVFQASAEDVQIVKIKKNLQLDNKDPVYKDYFINAGTDNGIKSNMSFEVFRKEAINDQYQSSSRGGTILLPVGRIKIIYSQTKLSVGRLLSLNKAKSSPLIDTQGFMVGDVLNLESVEQLGEKPPKTEKKVNKRVNAHNTKATKPLDESKSQVSIIKPERQIQISQSMPLELLPSRAPASINPPAPQIKISR